MHTLNLWVGHKVEKCCKEGVGCGISPSEVQIQNVHDKLRFRKGGAIISSLVKLK